MKLNTLLAGAAVAVAASLSAMSAQAADNLVQNGSFESGDLAGWSQFGDGSYTGVTGGCWDIGCPTDGDNLAYFGPVNGVGGISQDLGTGAGVYDISFDLSNDGGAFFSADFGGVNLLTSPGQEGVTHYSFTGISIDGPATLSFGTYNPPAYYTLDNVSVTAGVPEPAAWALMLTGFLGAGATLRSRRRVAVAAAA